MMGSLPRASVAITAARAELPVGQEVEVLARASVVPGVVVWMPAAGVVIAVAVTRPSSLAPSGVINSEAMTPTSSTHRTINTASGAREGLGCWGMKGGMMVWAGAHAWTG